MRDGYYRVTFPNGKKLVVEVYQNRTSDDSVLHLIRDGATFEEVEIFSQDEMKRKIAELRLR